MPSNLLLRVGLGAVLPNAADVEAVMGTWETINQQRSVGSSSDNSLLRSTYVLFTLPKLPTPPMSSL